jgi:hypothetical protein
MSEKLNNVLSNERIDNARKRIAKCLNMLEITTQEVQWACENEKWNDEVVYQIEEAAIKLGYALATLYRWDDPEESFKDEV